MEENKKLQKEKNMPGRSMTLGIISLVLQVIGGGALALYVTLGLFAFLILAFSGGRAFGEEIFIFYGSIIFILLDIIVATVLGIMAVVNGVKSKKCGAKGNKHIVGIICGSFTLIITLGYICMVVMTAISIMLESANL